MEFIFRHGWVMLIAVTIANYFILKPRTQKYVDQNPDLKIGYDKLFKAILIYGNIPWVIMALGDITAQTNSVFDYFNPKSFNPFVLTFHFYIIIVWALSVRWVYFKNGADFLIRHPGFVHIRGFGNSVTPTSTLVKIFFALALLGGIAGMTMMWLVDFPTFPIK